MDVADRQTRIVIAEDESIIRMDLRESLEEEGYVVVADVGRGDLAVDAVRTHRPDVAIFDIKMPGMDGLAAARIVSEEKLSPVVMLTAFSQREIIEQARDAGALAYIVKPFQRTDLVPAVELAIARFREIQDLAEERDDLGRQLELRKLLDRAKGVLQDQCKLPEAEAYAFMQRTAMSARLRMADVAQGVLDGSIRP
jgi:AmiR/NasT family two-component response regulator